MSESGLNQKSVIIIGAGPAGLTAAFELNAADRQGVRVVEADAQVGGISRTVNHNGNRIDIGGHRFFSKSDWVMKWWLDKLPLADEGVIGSIKPVNAHAFLAYQGQKREVNTPALPHGSGDEVMLLRDRISRILFSGKLFDYPLKLNVGTALKLGLWPCLLFGLSYIKARLLPVKPENTLEDFFINRFGRRLYLRFFKEYTEKVWGRSCREISAAWGAQRVKGLSISKAIAHAWRQIFSKKKIADAQQTSLIEHFLYPKFGPGQMWETVATQLQRSGVPIEMQTKVVGFKLNENRIAEVQTRNIVTGESCWRSADTVISTMPIRDLVEAIEGDVPDDVRKIAAALEYRDFITVGLLYKNLVWNDEKQVDGRASIPDNWIYIQEPGVKVGRLQIFNNWSPYMVSKSDRVWVGLEFFCNEGDELWQSIDADLIELAKREMTQIKLANSEDCVDAVVIRMPKAYPGYYGAYEHFDVVRRYLDSIPNLFLIGRNGMHRYNNQDHSMLSAKCAVEAILAGSTDKSAIWDVNIDDDYHEEIEQEVNSK